MTLLQAVAIVVGVGFALALISAINGRMSNTGPGPKARLVELAIPFAIRWVLYSGGVAIALTLQYLLTSFKA
jgi:hypothetical protein